jgi:hypothetical protein
MALNMGLDWKERKIIWEKAGEVSNKKAYVTNGETSR